MGSVSDVPGHARERPPDQMLTLRDSKHEKALVLATLAILVWLPLPLGSNRLWSAALLVVLVAGVMLARALAALRHPRSQRLRVPRVGWVLFGLLAAVQLWVVLQLWLGISVDQGATALRLVLGSAYSLLFLIVVDLFNDRRRLTLLLAVLTVSGVAQAFFGALMTLSGGADWLPFGLAELNHGVATGTFVNRNHLAGYLELTLACGVGLLMALRDGRSFRWYRLPELLSGPKAAIRLALVIMVIALVMTHSRMGNTAFFSSLILVGAVFVLSHRAHRVRNGLILVSLLLIDLLIISQYFGLERLADRLLQTQIEDRVVAGEVVRRENVSRDDVAIYAVPQFRERPLVGFGAGAFESSFQRFPGPDIPGHFDHAHNDYLEFAIELGLVGVAPLGLFVSLVLWQALRAILWRGSLYRNGVGLGAAMGSLALMIHSSADFNLQIPANAATFVVICALAVLATHHPSPARDPERARGRAAAPVMDG